MSNRRWDRYYEHNKNYNSYNDNWSKNSIYSPGIMSYNSRRYPTTNDKYSGNNFSERIQVPRRSDHEFTSQRNNSNTYRTMNHYFKFQTFQNNTYKLNENISRKNFSKEVLDKDKVLEIPTIDKRSSEIGKPTDDVNSSKPSNSAPVKLKSKRNASSGNVLSIEEAVKISANNDNDKTNIIEHYIVAKKQKLDQATASNVSNIDTESVTSMNPRLKDLETYDKQSSNMKQQMKEMAIDLRRLKDEFMKKYDEYKEMNIKRKTLKEKIKKICQVLAKRDEDESDSSDLDIQIGLVNGLINIGSRAEVEGTDSEDSDVQIVTEFLAVEDSSIDENSADDQLTLQEVTESSNCPTSQIINSSNFIKESKPTPDETPLKVENPNNEKTNSFQFLVKPDEENGLFCAIEPKLNTILVSDEEKTFITDIKVFNNRLFVSASHGLLRQYHLGTQECVMDYKGHQGLIHCILPTVQPIGIKRLLSGGFDKILFIHNIDTGVVLNKIDDDKPILSICDLLDFVYFGTAAGKVVTFCLGENKKKSSFSASEKGISCITATKDSNNHLLFVGANSGEYSMWDAITFIKLKIITPLSHVEIPMGFIVLQKQRILAFTRNYVHFIHYSKPKSTATFNHFDPINSMCLTRNYIILGGTNGKVSVYKIKGSYIPKTPIRTISNSNSAIISLTFYNNTIVTGDKTGKVYFNRLAES